MAFPSFRASRPGNARALLALAAALACLPAAAQTGAAPAAGPSALRDWNLPAGPLGVTLVRIAEAAGQAISVPPALVQGLQAPAVSGRLSTIQAAHAALAGSALELFTTANGTLSVRARHAPATPEAATLGEVRVTARTDAETALTPVSGYVARQTRLGSKTDTPLLELPQSVSVVTRDELDARGVQSVTEALRYVPGVAIETYGPDSKGYDWMMIRGFNGQATSDYRDGLRQAGYSYSLFRTEPYGMERIDILRGPASALYGQSETGGIIDRTTKRPTGERLREVQLRAGTNSLRQAGFDLGDAFGEDGSHAWRLTGLLRDGDNVFGDRDDRVYLAPSLALRLGRDTRLTLTAEFLRDRAGLANNWSWTYPGPRPTHVSYSQASFDRFDHNQASLGYQLEHRLGEDWTFRQNARAGIVDVPQFNKTMLNGLQADGHTVNRYGFRREEMLRQFALDNQLSGRVRQGDVEHQLLLGLDLARLNADARRWIGALPALDLNAPRYDLAFPLPSTLQMDNHVEQQQAGLYAQDQIRFGRHWIATLGGRFDQARTTVNSRTGAAPQVQTDHAFTGRAALTYSRAGWAPYVSYATSFLPLAGTNTSTGRAFDPTEGKQFEVGVKYQPDEDSLFTAALFDLRKTNGATTDPLTGFTRQIGETRSRGLELEAKTAVRKGWNLAANYTYHQVEVTRSDTPAELGKWPTLVPRHIASVWTDYRFGDTGLGMSLGLRHVGKTYGDAANLVAVGGRTLVDAAIHYEVERWRFALNINNLLDKEYLSTCSSSACYWGASRSALLTARYRW
ncbi:MAG: TonB-dependent siderophore receptor [Burkholderiaceae bacterium]|jgi:iron complex outermembrane receptor protein|nr:TonB-dependent siderophore receptor [Burkholderiaceae bacterium]